MISPPSLHPGDCIAIVAPARKVSLEELLPAIQLVREQGFEVLESPHLYGASHQFSGTDAERLSDLQWAIDHPEIKAIWCARGGYGLGRILDQLDTSVLQNRPKWVIGFSDITLLLNRLNNEGLLSLHAPMALHAGQESLKEDILALFGILKGKYQDLTWPIHSEQKEVQAEGVLIGGNLSMLAHSVGSASFPKGEEAILFLEEIDEYYYHIDRLFHQLQHAGIFERARALVFGSFTEMKDHSIPFGEDEQLIASKFCKRNTLPLISGFPAGHGIRNQPLILGARVAIRVKEGNASLSYLPG
jgi:muramoyltetrapeptide carboxypeptidase